MSTRGDNETAKLRINVSLLKINPCVNLVGTHYYLFVHIFKVESQLNRLLTQLQDLEDMREELDEGEYETIRQVL